MSEALKLAREAASKRYEWAGDQLARVHEKFARTGDDIAWQRNVSLEEASKDVAVAKATLDAIDAAIAAESMEAVDPRELPELRIDLGGGRPARLWASTKNLARVVEIAHELGFPAGGEAAADVEPGLVGERAGESIVSSATAEELQRKGAELMGKLVADSDASDRPIQIGDIVQLKGEFKVVGMREEPSPFRILNGPCFEEAGPADVVYTVQSKASTRYLVGDEIEVRASDLRRL